MQFKLTEEQKAQRKKFSQLKRERTSKTQTVKRVTLSPAMIEELQNAHPLRSRLFWWGYRHDFPDVKAFPYAIGPGAYCWGVVLHCRIEMVNAILNVIEGDTPAREDEDA